MLRNCAEKNSFEINSPKAYKTATDFNLPTAPKKENMKGTGEI
jgi:hypothetical protein